MLLLPRRGNRLVEEYTAFYFSAVGTKDFNTCRAYGTGYYIFCCATKLLSLTGLYLPAKWIAYYL